MAQRGEAARRAAVSVLVWLLSLQQNKALLASVLLKHMIDTSVTKSEVSSQGTGELVGELVLV